MKSAIISAVQQLTKAHESRLAIEKLYVGMRHLFNRGFYRPLDALLTLQPEIYGSIDDPNKVELDGLVYVMDRLPKGLAGCRNIKLVSEGGYYQSGFEVIIPRHRRRNCYRVDKDQMLIEVDPGTQ